MFDVFSTHSIQLLSFLAAVVFIAGCIRGFAGFGAGMFFIPLATSVVSPPIAAANFLVIDGVVALPLLKNAVRICDWRTVLPAVLGSVLFVHAGAYLLASTDPLLLRWIIFAIVTSLLLLLASGWRYQKRPSPPVSFSVGVTSGLLGGMSQVSAPPVAAFWLASAKEPAVVRANLIVFFALAGIGTFIAYALNDIFTLEVAQLLVITIPCYAAGLLVGAKGFSASDPKLYKRIAYILIGLSAITSIPLLDPYLR